MESITALWGWNILYLTGIIITFFLSSLLFIKKSKNNADYLLAAWLLILGVHLTLFYLTHSGRYLQWPYLLGFEIPMPLLHGPFLYLYTAVLTGQLPEKQRWLFHFIPAGIAYAVIMPFLLLPLHHKTAVYLHEGRGYETLMLYMLFAIYLSGVTYVVLSLLLLRKHRQRILHRFSDTEKINLNWLRYLITGIAVIWLAILWSKDAAIYTLTVMLVLFIGYFGIRQVGILNDHAGSMEPVLTPDAAWAALPEMVTGDIPDQEEQVRYQKSRLPQGTIDRIREQLSQVMIHEELFKDPALTLGDLSKRLQVHPNQLSQVINLAEGKTFYDYINLLRVEAFEKQLAHSGNEKYTLLSLAFDCGFNSKASFNRNFKKYRGITPTEYQKQQNNNPS